MGHSIDFEGDLELKNVGASKSSSLYIDRAIYLYTDT